MASRLDETTLRSWILVQLGAPIVQPHLTECQLDQAIAEAKSWFASKRGLESEVFLPCSQGISTIELPEDVDTVLEVVFEESANLFTLGYVSGQAPYETPLVPMGYTAQVAGQYSAILQFAQHFEQSRRVMSAEPDWEQAGRVLRVYAVPAESTRVWVRYSTSVFNVDRLTEREARLIRRMALVQAKKILTQVRGIYESGFQGSQGTTNFNLSILDTTEEESKLDAEILSLGPPLGVITG